MIECSSLLVTSHTVFRWILFHEEFVVLSAAHDVERVPSIFSGRAWILKAKMFLWQNAPGFRQKLNLARYRAQMSVPITLPGQIGQDVLEFAVKGKVTLWFFFKLELSSNLWKKHPRVPSFGCCWEQFQWKLSSQNWKAWLSTRWLLCNHVASFTLVGLRAVENAANEDWWDVLSRNTLSKGTMCTTFWSKFRYQNSSW